MSHLMSTVNPEAIREMEPDRLPAAGDFVIFMCRPGEGRRGRYEFPALVIGRNDSRGPNGLDIVVIYDANDMVDLDSVQECGEHLESFCWKRRDMPTKVVNDVSSEIAELRRRLDLLYEKIYGGYNEPSKSLMDYLADFEQRVKAVEALAGAPKKAGKGGKAA